MLLYYLVPSKIDYWLASFPTLTSLGNLDLAKHVTTSQSLPLMPLQLATWFVLSPSSSLCSNVTFSPQKAFLKSFPMMPLACPLPFLLYFSPEHLDWVFSIFLGILLP